MPDRRSLSYWKAALVVGAMAVVGVAVYFGVATSGPSPEEARQLIQEKNVALGYLENQKLDEATKALNAISVRLPDDPLVLRNLAVVRALALGDEGVEATAETVQAATAALQEMARREGETTNYHWLMLHVALAARDFDAADVQLAAILAADPDDVSAWFTKFRALQLKGEQDLDPEALAALERACERRPENAWLRLEWLRTMGSELLRDPDANDGPPDESQGAARFGDLAKQIALSRTALEPFAPIIRTHTKVDPLDLLDEADQAIQQRQWRQAGQKLLMLGHVFLPHAALDRLLVQRHPLEFIATEFQPGVLKNLPAADVELAAPVVFVESQVAAVDEPGGQAKVSSKGAMDLQLVDFDLDGRLDIVVLLPGKVSVWSRGKSGESWREIAAVEVSGAERLIVQDLDADFDETARAVRLPEEAAGAKPPAPDLRALCPTADVDVVAYGPGGVTLLENRHVPATSSRTLVAVAGDQFPSEPKNLTAAAAADLEGDGDLDLVLAAEGQLHRWINGGAWRFISAAIEARPDVAQLLALDLDRDVDIDIIVASPAEAGWLENVRHGQFRWRTFRREMPDLAQASALEVVDVDGNASWDLVGATPGGMRLVTTLTPQPGNLRQSQSILIGDSQPSGLTALDFDNDGYEDLLAWSPQAAIIARSQDAKNPAGRTWNLEQPQFRTSAGVLSVAGGDLDGDGDLDAAGATDAGVTLMINDGGNQNHWIDVALQAQQIKGQQISPSGRVSPYGVGSLLELRSGQRYQARVVRGQTTHFGIGQSARADVIRVLWLNGIPHNIMQPSADEFVCEQQVLNTSCPYLYAWNGERFVFVTDLLWNAPLGLQLSEGVLAPSRDWEYLKIPGEMLAAKDGKYVFQITEELWEAAYFDQVRLIAVDHPAEVQIYSNEKVGPPALAEFKIHTASQPRTIAAVKNHHGRDLLSDVAREDGIYAQVHDRKLRQGVVEDGYLELDLGNLPGGKQVTLFLTGWVFPSSTSINVALSQGGSTPPPKPPSLLVPDGNGGWNEALPFMGFPGGKTKTIAIDLTGVVNADDPRLRIATTMEFYWDHIFYTVDDPAAEVRTTELELASADLHDRGYSKVVPGSHHGPEQFFYDEVSLEPKWPPMHGAFTRLGNVKELLESRDDRLLVIGAGDEVTVKFRVPEQPIPAGWKRDFLLYNAGWEKDCNVLTVLGETVEPLPFQAMTAYPWPPGENAPSSREHQEYLRKYQTRRQTPQFWRTIQRFP